MTPEREKELMKAKEAMTSDLQKYCDKFNMSALDVLAVLSYMVGGATSDDRRQT